MKIVSRNMIIATIAKLITILSGIIAQRFILLSFGSEINGLTASISQLITYFALLEAGLGVASIQALYKPLANDDWNSISGILSATKRQYRQTGILFLLCLLVLSFIMPFVVNSGLNSTFIVSLTFLSGIGNVISYMFIGKYQVLLNADQKISIIYILDSGLSVFNCILKVYVINAGYSILVVQVVIIVSVLIRLVILYLYVNYSYKNIDTKAYPDMHATKKRWNVLIHQMVGMVTNNTDVIVLTIFSNLKVVSVYSVYNFVFGNISALLSTIFAQAPLATFGNLIERKDEKLGQYYDIFELLFTVLLFIVLTSVLILTIPFIKLYTKSVTDINYIDYTFAILFALYAFLNLVRIPVIVMVTASGHFKETQKGAILEATLNLAFSIPLFFILGMRGLIIGTIIALTYRSIDLIIYAYKNILNKSFLGLIKLLLNCCCISLFIIIVYNQCINVNITNWIQWIIIGIMVFISTSILFSLNTIVLYKNNVRFAISLIRRK